MDNKTRKRRKEFIDDEIFKHFNEKYFLEMKEVLKKAAKKFKESNK